MHDQVNFWHEILFANIPDERSGSPYYKHGVGPKTWKIGGQHTLEQGHLLGLDLEFVS